jgi:HSP20 family molecular chaperone IbpA
MTLADWQSLRALETLHQHMGNIMADLMQASYESTLWVGSNCSDWASSIDIQENDASMTLLIQLPDVNAEDLEIEVTQETAVIRGIQRQDEVEGYFSPSQFQSIIPFPSPIHPEAVRAELNGNILTLTLLKVGKIQRRGFRISLSSDRPASVPQLLRQIETR